MVPHTRSPGSTSPNAQLRSGAASPRAGAAQPVAAGLLSRNPASYRDFKHCLTVVVVGPCGYRTNQLLGHLSEQADNKGLGFCALSAGTSEADLRSLLRAQDIPGGTVVLVSEADEGATSPPAWIVQALRDDHHNVNARTKLLPAESSQAWNCADAVREPSPHSDGAHASGDDTPVGYSAESLGNPTPHWQSLGAFGSFLSYARNRSADIYQHTSPSTSSSGSSSSREVSDPDPSSDEASDDESSDKPQSPRFYASQQDIQRYRTLLKSPSVFPRERDALALYRHFNAQTKGAVPLLPPRYVSDPYANSVDADFDEYERKQLASNPVAHALYRWISLGVDACELPAWQRLEDMEQAPAFIALLQRLDSMYPDENANISDLLVDIVERLVVDPSFLDPFQAMLVDATASCDDRVSLALHQMQTLLIVADARENGSMGHLLAVVDAARQVFRREQLLQVADEKFKRLLQQQQLDYAQYAGHDDDDDEAADDRPRLDEIETHLAYAHLIQTNGLLDLGGPVPDAKFIGESLSHVSDNDIWQAVDTIRANEGSGFVDFLAMWPAWQESLAVSHPQQVEALNASLLDDQMLERVRQQASGAVDSLIAQGNLPESLRNESRITEENRIVRAMQLDAWKKLTTEVLASL